MTIVQQLKIEQLSFYSVINHRTNHHIYLVSMFALMNSMKFYFKIQNTKEKGRWDGFKLDLHSKFC